MNKALHWTDEAPKESGWYFFKWSDSPNKRKSMVYVDMDDDLLCFAGRPPVSLSEILEKRTMKLAGPISEPDEE